MQKIFRSIKKELRRLEHVEFRTPSLECACVDVAVMADFGSSPNSQK